MIEDHKNYQSSQIRSYLYQLVSRNNSYEKINFMEKKKHEFFHGRSALEKNIRYIVLENPSFTFRKTQSSTITVR